MSNILEIIMHNQLNSYVSKHNILRPTQFGFRKECGCEKAIFDLIDDILSAIDRGFLTALVLIDHGKASDIVIHLELLKVVQSIGICSTAFNLFHNFLFRQLKWEMEYLSL